MSGMKQDFSVYGLSCSACAAAVERAVSRVNGVTGVNVSLLGNFMTVEYDEKICKSADIIKAVEDIGYGAGESNSAAEETKERGGHAIKDTPQFKRFVVSAIFLLPLIYLNLAGMLSLPSVKNADPYVMFVLSLVILVVNREYFKKGIKGIINRSPGMDALISIGAAAGFLYSTAMVIRNIIVTGTFLFTDKLNRLNPNSMGNTGETMYFFESAGMIFTLITLGKMLEAGSKEKTMDAINKLSRLLPDTVNILSEDGERKTDVKNLSVDDIMVIRPGERLAADGIVVSGNGSFDTSSLTGESVYKECFAESEVYAGYMCVDGFLNVKVTKAGADTVLSNIVRTVKTVGTSKSQSVRLADKISSYFVPIVVAVSVVTFVTWMIILKDCYAALNFAISVLVVSCPCALGLATPTAVMTGTGNAATNGLLIRNIESLEKAGRVDTVVFDKTGTLTKGSLSVTDICPAGKTKIPVLIYTAAVAERVSNHPYAVAINKKALESYSLKELMNEQIDSSSVIPGKGISVNIGELTLLAGNRLLMEESNVDVSSTDDTVNEYLLKGKTVIYFARNNKYLGVMALCDEQRSDSKETISELKKLNIESVLLTGDNKESADKVSGNLGIEKTISNVLPDEKYAEVIKLKEQGRTIMMVGDGINDAPALTGADVSVAVSGGSDIATDCADIILLNSSISKVAYAIKLSRRVYTIIKQNLFWALIYNCLLIPVAAGVFYGMCGLKLTPGLSALCMSLSSLFVVTNALRLKKH